MKTIDNDIKTGQFKQIYLLYGEEQYLIRQYRDKLKKAMVAEDDTMNFSSFEGNDINQKEIIDLAETLPFFADRRVILIEDSGFFKSSCEDLAEYLTQVAPATHFIFVEEEVDKINPVMKQIMQALADLDAKERDLIASFQKVGGSLRAAIEEGEKARVSLAEQVDGDGLHSQLFQGKGELDTLFHRLTHTDDAAAADVHAYVAGGLQGAQLVFLRVRAAQGGEERGGCFQIAVIACDAGIVQGSQFLFVQQAQRGA